MKLHERLTIPLDNINIDAFRHAIRRDSQMHPYK